MFMGTVNKLLSDRNRRSLGLEPVGVTRGYGDAEDYPGALATGEFHCGLLAALHRAMSAAVPTRFGRAKTTPPGREPFDSFADEAATPQSPRRATRRIADRSPRASASPVL